MNTINKVFKKTVSDFNLNTLYRYQGNGIEGTSIKHLVIDKSNPCMEFKIKGNIYFSKSYDHHKYFVRKRLKQEMNSYLNDKDLPIITQSNIRLLANYKKIKQSIIQDHCYFKGESIRLTVSNNLINLLKQNCVKQELKSKHLDVPELSDRRKYGGAYGIPDEWLQLLNSLTLFYNCVDIDYDDVLNYLYKVRLNYISDYKSDVTDFLQLKKQTTYINEKIYSPYHKYIILDNIEKIIDKKEYIKNSNLEKYPNQTIKEIIDEYKILRDYILLNIEKEYKNKILRLK